MAIDTTSILGNDISFDFKAKDIIIDQSNDFGISIGNSNLAQAIPLRLLTNIGELKSNPSYGSNLNLIIGRPRTDANLGLAALYIQNAIDQEYRVKKLNQLDVKWTFNGSTWDLQINLKITPINATAPQNLIVLYQI